jgi:hypothetical protein
MVVVLLQPTDHCVQGHQTGSGDDPGLSPTAPQDLPSPLRSRMSALDVRFSQQVLNLLIYESLAAREN